MGENIVLHVFTRSIAGYKVFSRSSDYRRMIETIYYYRYEREKKFSKIFDLESEDKGEKIVKVICYNLMPTHIHLVLEELKEKGISKFMANILNSYTRYFNTKYKRKGPLWESRFKHVLVETDEQLLHLTRYIHLNQTTSGLVKRPEDWEFSSYREYIKDKRVGLVICEFDHILEIEPVSYRKFVEDYIDFQKELHKIKKLIEFEKAR